MLGTHALAPSWPHAEFGGQVCVQSMYVQLAVPLPSSTRTVALVRRVGKTRALERGKLLRPAKDLFVGRHCDQEASDDDNEDGDNDDGDDSA